MDEDITEENAKARACWVTGCKHINSHLTSAHRCPNCWSYGHGKNECGNLEALAKLQQMILLQLNYYDELIPLQNRCTIDGCRHPYSHYKSSHHCSYCGLRGDHRTNNCHYIQKNVNCKNDNDNECRNINYWVFEPIIGKLKGRGPLLSLVT